MMVFLVILLAVVAIGVMVLLTQTQSLKKTKLLLKESQDKTLKLEQKIESSHLELKKNRDELEREKNALREARDLAKKKQKRLANTNEAEPQFSANEAAMTNKNLEDSKKALDAMEAQLEQLKGEQKQKEETIRSSVVAELSKNDADKETEIAGLKKQIDDLKEELKKQKRLMRPEGVKVDLKTLPDEAAAEFARVFRKAEQHERLHGVARAKLHLAQEKFTELQKRYFSVCRELALLAGNEEEIEPIKARDIAEKMVSNHKMPSHEKSSQDQNISSKTHNDGDEENNTDSQQPS